MNSWRKLQVLVIGYNRDTCTERAAELAYRVGRAVATRGAVLVSGGLGGVMEAASKGAVEAGGLVLGIIPQKDMKEANPYCNVVVATGMGHLRNFLNVYSSDGVIVVGGGAGTLTELAAAYIEGKPIVAVMGSGGVADEFANRYLDERKSVMIRSAETPEEAVDLLMSLIREKPPQG
ncbi:MAG: TIGR00725 family protein [Thaumarchaeota archaeon]|nr:TIGR00725 family protein [Candidatus Calditenuaceae archaeon]